MAEYLGETWGLRSSFHRLVRVCVAGFAAPASHLCPLWQDIQTWLILLGLTHNPLAGSYLTLAALQAPPPHTITPVHTVHQQGYP